MKHLIDDLTLSLQAVSQARQAYVDFIEMKFAEAVKRENPQTPEQFTTLYKRIQTSFEAFEQYQKLMNLYGCIGAQSNEYLKALQNLEIKKGAA